MAKYEITSTKVPEYDPGATTGDPVARTELTIRWDAVPSDAALRQFRDQYPVHFYDAFHFVEGVGKVA